jgi:hypothetical protein
MKRPALRRIFSTPFIVTAIAAITGCAVPIKIDPAAPVVPAGEPDAPPQAVSAITFDVQAVENRTWTPRIRGLQVDQRVLARPPLSQIIRDDVVAFLTRHARVDPNAPTELRVTVRKAQIIKYSWPVASAALPSRGLGTETDVEVALLRGGTTVARCQFSDPVQIEGSYIFRSSTYSKVVERLVTRYRQVLTDALGSRCAPLIKK